MTNPLKDLDPETLNAIQTACDLALSRFDLEREWDRLPGVIRTNLDAVADLERHTHRALSDLNPN